MNRIPGVELKWVADAVGPGGGIQSVAWIGRSSTEMYAIDVLDRSGHIQKLALRRYVDTERLATDPWYRPEHEAEALRILAGTEVLAPRLIAEDVAARQCQVPTLLETRIPGRPIARRPADLDRYLSMAAEILHRIHAVDPSLAATLPAYAPYEPPSTLPIPPWSARPALWIRVLEVLTGPVPLDEGKFIHRDYHSGNILLRRGRITGVVDWLTACRGPRSIDLARMRLNLVRDFDLRTADRFLVLYREGADSAWSHDPYWDLLDAVDSAQDEPRLRTRPQSAAWDRFERWVGNALASLR